MEKFRVLLESREMAIVPEPERLEYPGFCRECGTRAEFVSVEGKQRPKCPGCGRVEYLDPKLAVAVLLIQADRILLGKRGPGTRQPGKWSFPAGFVERGELVEAAAAREAREETGLDVSIGTLLGLFSEESEPVVLAVFEGTIVSGTARADDDLTELGWFALDGLPELAFPRDEQIVSAWVMCAKNSS